MPTPATTANSIHETPRQHHPPPVLYTYQDALDHVMNAHLSSNNNTAAAAKKDKKLCYELELFEQNLEDLLQTESNPPSSSSSISHEPKKEDDDQETETSDNEETSGEACYESLPDDIVNSDLSEWNCIFSEPNTITNLSLCSSNSISSSDITTTTTSTTASSSSTTSPQNVNGAGGNRKKRFKANDNSIPDLAATSVPQPSPVPISTQSTPIPLITNTKNLKRFYYKPFLVYKCQICSRKMSSFDLEHWLQHDREAHQKIFTNNFKPLTQGFAYQQVTCVKAPITSTSSSSPTPNVAMTANHQLVKQFESFTDFLSNFKEISSTHGGTADSIKLIPCLICGTELRFTLIDMLKHYQSEHEFNIMLNLKPYVTLDDLEILHTLYINNYVLVCQGVHLRRRCFIRVPPLLTVTSPG